MTRGLAGVGTVATFVLFAACSGRVAPPVAQPTPLESTVNTGSLVRLDGSGSKDPEGRHLSFEWNFVRVPTGSAATLQDADKMLPSFTADMSGEYVIQLVVSNGAVSSPPAEVRVHATLCGSAALVATSIGIRKVVDPDLGDQSPVPANPNVGARVTFGAEFKDPNAACGPHVEPISLKWSVLAKPAGSAAQIDWSNSATPALVPDKPGTYQLSVTAIDGLGFSADTFFTFNTSTCGANAPIASISPASPQPINANAPLPLSASAISADNTACPARFAATFSFGWSVMPDHPAQKGNLSANSGTSTVFQASTPGGYEVRLVAVSSNGKSGGASARVKVLMCGSAVPVIIATSNTPAFPARMQDVILAAKVADAEPGCAIAPAIAFTWSIYSLPQGSATVLKSPAGAAHFVPDVEGTYVFRVVASDSTGLSSEPAFMNIAVLNADPAASTIAVRGGAGGPTVVADNLDSGIVTMTVRNGRGQPIAQLPVRIDSTGVSNTFNPGGGSFAVGTTDPNGVFVATMASTKAELKTFKGIVQPVSSDPASLPLELSQHPQLEYVSGPAASLALTGLPSAVTAGDQNTVTVTAFDKFLNVAKGPNAYTGTVHFTSTDARATLPADFTFLPSDNGAHAFTTPVRLVTAGSQAVSATDSAHATDPNFTAARSVVVNAGAAASFTVLVANNPAATAVPSNVTVTARDPFSNVATGYAGAVHLTSTDSLAILAGNSTLTNGVKTFANGVTFRTVGAQTVTATDAGALAIAGTSAAITVNAWFSTTDGTLYARRLAVDPATGNAYAATDPTGIFISSDHGASWLAATAQPADPHVEDIAVAPGSRLYAATAGGVFSSNGANNGAGGNGTIWSGANGGAAGMLSNLAALSIVADPTDPAGKTVYVGTTTSVFKTSDGGAIAWTSTAFPTANDPITALAVDPAGTVCAGTVSGKVYSRTKVAAAWTPLIALANSQEVDALSMPSTSTILVGTARGTVFLSSDGGSTWNAGVAAGTFPIFQIAFATGGTTGYAASAGGGIFKTTNGGGTTNWSAVKSGISNLVVRGVAVDSATTTTVFSGTNGRGFFTTLTAGE